jgi:hypothetical protein
MLRNCWVKATRSYTLGVKELNLMLIVVNFKTYTHPPSGCPLPRAMDKI